MLVWKRADIDQNAGWTVRLTGQAHAAAVVLDQVAEAHLSFRWDHGGEVGFDLVGVGVGGQAEALGPPALNRPHGH